VSESEQRVVLHVGVPKSGTTYLQGLLAANRDLLKNAGILYPFVHPGAMFKGAVEVRGSHEKFGLTAADVEGEWLALCERAQEHEGTTIISHEVLAGANRQQIRTALEPLAGIDIHIVVTARDLGRQAVAHWQEEVKLGATFSFAEFEETQLRADTGPGLGPDDGGIRPHFWYAQDFADCLDRWAGRMGEGRAHLVPLPRPGVPAEELWHRFASAAGIPARAIDTSHHAPANPSLGVAEIALLRAVNAELGDRLDRRTYLQRVKRDYAEGTLAARPGPRPRSPYDLGELFQEKTARWLQQVADQHVVIHGDPADLAPVLAEDGDPRPDDVAVTEDPAAIAAGLVPEPEHRNRRWLGPFHK
jgi:hypothetical protein